MGGRQSPISRKGGLDHLSELGKLCEPSPNKILPTWHPNSTGVCRPSPVGSCLFVSHHPRLPSRSWQRRKLPPESLWPTNLESGFVSLCSKTWVFLNSLSQVFTNSAPSTVLQYQRQPGPTTQQPFVSKTSNPALQSRSAPLAPLQNGPSLASKPSSPPPPQQFVVQHSLFATPVTKTKDPPRYEEAIKQTRSTQPVLPEVSSVHSQQMDDLFDILIKSGEISFPIKEEPSPISKMKPVTASITTMPVNTVVSRPPPQVQIAPPVSLEPVNSLSASLENQLEAFLDGTLPSANDIAPLQSSSEDREPFSLIEDLQNDLLSHSSMLYQSHSPMETSEAQLVSGTPCLSLDLSDSNLDNMEWLDITMPTTSSGLTPLSTTAPSMFSADFLDPQDLPLPWD